MEMIKIRNSNCRSKRSIAFVADEPGKPGTPEITDYDRDFVDLKWKPPESDGGSPIKEYIVQRRDKLK